MGQYVLENPRVKKTRGFFTSRTGLGVSAWSAFS
ncbi:hypothetical protein J2S03_002000 [Alicyclobacillus cycloheptanicus]|uniref:Uncharacterized protein n=1 Tax=Alicyclobacillus cycloheptanicus TaxID=1457 RepID=A0ABT9XIJ9_9BACL|nr:hypothetical protein [Alicyclobacillus cycloheptanicus]